MTLITVLTQLCENLEARNRVAELEEARRIVVRHGARRVVLKCPPGRRASGGRCV